MTRTFTLLTAVVTLLLGTATLSADTLDGSRAGDSYGGALAVQTVQTQFGDNQSELNAGYGRASVSDGILRVLLTGNVQDNFNKLNVFIDSTSGGQNTIGPDTNNGGVNPGSFNDGIFDNYSGVGGGGSGNGPGFTFDSGFNADYVLINRRGGGKFDFNFLSIGNASVAEESFDIFSGSTVGANAGVGASSIGVAYDDSNVAGVLGGTGAADAAAAQAVLTGLELWIPLSAIGSPDLYDEILISAHVNNSNHDYLSNQSLGGFAAGQDNLGGDGAGNFNNDVSLLDLNNFTGTQHFSVLVVPEPSALGLLGLAGLGLVTRRRR